MEAKPGEAGRIVLRALMQDKPISFHSLLARCVDSALGGLFLSALMDLSHEKADEDGWIEWPQKDCSIATVMSRREQESTRTALRNLGILEEVVNGYPRKLRFRVNQEALAIVIEQQLEHLPALGAGSRAKPVPTDAARKKPHTNTIPAESMRAMFTALQEATRLDVAIERNRGMLNRKAAELLRAGKTPEHITRFMIWWATYWKGQKGQRPTLADIGAHMGEALAAAVVQGPLFQDQDIVEVRCG